MALPSKIVSGAYDTSYGLMQDGTTVPAKPVLVYTAADLQKIIPVVNQIIDAVKILLVTGSEMTLSSGAKVFTGSSATGSIKLLALIPCLLSSIISITLSTETGMRVATPSLLKEYHIIRLKISVF